MRGKFATDSTMHAQILEAAKEAGLRSVFVISTCNRTEIYGYATHPHELAVLLTRFTKGTTVDFFQYGFFKSGADALDHLFRVASGLDSQIVGDYEIQGQLKQAIAFAQLHGMLGPIMDRTINFVFQASKKIRSNTALSTGTVSVSFAAIEWLQQHLGQSPKKALLIGAGKFGRNVCKNVLHYLPQCSLTIMNRTASTAVELAENAGASFLPFEALETVADDFDILLVSTNAIDPIVLAKYFTTQKQRYILDLSVPANVEPAVAALPGTQLLNVDDISSMLDKTMEKRRLEIPAAEAIIAEFKNEFYTWLQTYRHTPGIKDVKEKLFHLSGLNHTPCEMADAATFAKQKQQEENIRKTVNTLAVNLKTKKEKGCQFITAYHSFLSQYQLAVNDIE